MYYKDDPSLGDYFYNCGEYATNLLNLNVNIKQSHVTDSNCNFAFIDSVELPKHNEKSLFILYSHGTEESFYKGEESLPFIDSTINSDICLEGGLIYTNSCLTGNTFGRNLPQKGASFFGFDKEVSISLDYQKIFVECTNFGLYRLIKGDTLEESKHHAQEKFNEKIDETYEYSMFAASALEDAKNSIVIFGNTSKRFI
jgi:hypothetical protein